MVSITVYCFTIFGWFKAFIISISCLMYFYKNGLFLTCCLSIALTANDSPFFVAKKTYPKAPLPNPFEISNPSASKGTLMSAENFLVFSPILLIKFGISKRMYRNRRFVLISLNLNNKWYFCVLNVYDPIYYFIR